MSVSVMDTGAQSPEMVKAMERILQLPEKKLQRVVKLGRLFRESEDWQEQRDILNVLAEVLQPVLSGLALPVGNIDSTVDPEAMRKVEAYRQSVGRRIRSARKQRKLTQDRLAELSGLPQSHVCRLEQGKHAATNDTISRLAKALGVTPGELDPAYE